jgi:hypothetical protein
MQKTTNNSSIDIATIKRQHKMEAGRLVRMTTRQGIEEPCEGKLSSTVCAVRRVLIYLLEAGKLGKGFWVTGIPEGET